MKFNTKDVAAPVAISPYMDLGDQSAFIKSIELKEARSGSKQVIFHMESEPVDVPGFKPVDDAKGRVGRVAASIYLKDDEAKMMWVTERILPIAISLGVREKVDSIETSSFEEYITKVEEVLKNKPTKWLIGGEEYANQQGDIKVKLRLPRYNFVGATVQEFDKSNKYHYTTFNPGNNFTSSDTAQNSADDLPF